MISIFNFSLSVTRILKKILCLVCGLLLSNACTQLKPDCLPGDSGCQNPLATALLYAALPQHNFVAIGHEGATSKIYHSRDGQVWQDVSPVDSITLRALTRGDFFITGGNNTTFYYSSDGQNWSQTTNSISQVQSLAYGNGRYVALSTGANEVSYSDNGILWQTGTPPATGDENYEAIHTNGFFIGTGVIGDERRSADGKTWSAYNTPGKFSDSFGIAANGSRVITLANSAAGEVCISTDTGANFACANGSGAPSFIRDVEYNGSHFIAVGQNGAIYRSTDGEASNWSANLGPGGSNTLESITSGNNTLVAVGQNGSIHYSVDAGLSWSTNVGPGGSVFIRRVIYGVYYR